MAATKVSPIGLLLILAVPFFGWQVFSDGPLAHYVMEGLLIASLSLKIAYDNGSAWYAVGLFGAALGVMQAGCGVFYNWDAGGFVCDITTGRPVSLVVGCAAALVAAGVYKRGGGN